MVSVQVVEMSKGHGLILIASAIIVTMIMLPTIVRADVLMMRPGAEHTKTYYLDQGDVISWDWNIIGDVKADFWIEDEEGTTYRFVDNATSNRGSFVTPMAGEWCVKFRNDSPDPAGATINYTIRINPPSNGLTWVILGIGSIVIVVVVVLLLLLLRRKRKKVVSVSSELHD
jgi:hypothetical protein